MSRVGIGKEGKSSKERVSLERISNIVRRRSCATSEEQEGNKTCSSDLHEKEEKTP